MNQEAQKLYEEHQKKWAYIVKKHQAGRPFFWVGLAGMVIGAIVSTPLWIAGAVLSFGFLVKQQHWSSKMTECLKCWDKIEEIDGSMK